MRRARASSPVAPRASGTATTWLRVAATGRALCCKTACKYPIRPPPRRVGRAAVRRGRNDSNVAYSSTPVAALLRDAAPTCVDATLKHFSPPMLRGHGTLKSILGRSVIPSKRRRPASESEDDVPATPANRSRSATPDQSRHLRRSGSSSAAQPAEPDAPCKVVELPCPVCGESLAKNSSPESHVGALQLLVIRTRWPRGHFGSMSALFCGKTQCVLPATVL